jgi:hypothetical protein
MKHRLNFALLFVFVLGIVGFESWAGAKGHDTEGQPQTSTLHSTPLIMETDDWDRTLVDLDGSGGVSLSLDAANTPHISYYAQDEWGQTPATWRYATKHGSSWNIVQVVDPSVFQAADLPSSSLIVDKSNSPHIAFGLFRGNYRIPMLITHAFKQDGTWQFEEVEAIEKTCAGPFVNLLADSSGKLHLFYFVSVNYNNKCISELRYARRAGANSWQVSTLVQDSVSGYSVLIDGEDNFHLAYTSNDDEDRSLNYSKFNSVAQFSPATVFIKQWPQQISSHSITLDRSNMPHIAFAFYEPYGYRLYVAHQGATEWIIEDSGQIMGQSPKIDSFVDAQDDLHIYAGNVYGFNAVVEHYYKTQDGWQKEQIGAPAANISFILDSSEDIHGAAVYFSYGTESNWSLWYLHKPGDTPTYSISGKVTKQDGAPLPGVVVSTAAGHATTDTNGNYTISGLVAGTYDVGPTLAGYSFVPATRSVTIPQNAVSQDFVGTPDAMTDTDGDGLLDSWEINGYDHDNDGIVDVDLPAMGADPYKPDIFVEVDWREVNGQSQKPNPEAIRKVVQAFANAPVYDDSGNLVGTGINLHVDVGPDSTDWVTMKKWDKYGEGKKVDVFIEETVHLGKEEDKELLLRVYRDHFLKARHKVFHYSLWINKLILPGDPAQGETLGGSTANNGFPSFIISLGSMTNRKGSVSEQASTFMHELGHNLGLNHGGDQGLDGSDKEAFDYKPNYLSVMNYSFGVTGLIINGKDGCDECFDYSRVELPSLNEAALYEHIGLNGGNEVNPYGTKYRRSDPWFCPPLGRYVSFSLVREDANNKVDWSCNVLIDSIPVREDVNGQGGDAQVLTGYNDWLNLDFNYAHRFLRPQMTTYRSSRLSSYEFDPAYIVPELSIEEARAIPGISEVRAQIVGLVTPEQVEPLDTITYAVSVYTVDFGTIQSFVPRVNLPDSFSYIPNSTSGYLGANPVISGNQLTWPSIEIPDNTMVREFSFQVRVGLTEDTFDTSFSGTSSTGFVLSNEVEVRVQWESLERLFLPIIVH